MSQIRVGRLDWRTGDRQRLGSRAMTPLLGGARGVADGDVVVVG
jgi:hypothetical protein